MSTKMGKVTERQLLVAGEWQPGGSQAEVHSPYDGTLVSRVAQASDAQVELALKTAWEARGMLQRRSTGERREVLHGIVKGLEARGEELAQSICREAGKPIRAARTEVARAREVFTLAAAELANFGGRTLPVDLDAASRGYTCETRRFPAGVVVGVVPFNFPLNLGAHKVAPALAVGAPILVKPPPQAPGAQLILAELALAAGAPAAAMQVLPCDNARAEKLATDARVRVLSFTGSDRVGWALRAKAAGKVVLELGGNAAVIVCADADVDRAAERCALGAFAYAGQVCIKVQRIFVASEIHDAFLAKLLERTRALGVGDPANEATVVGPVIDEASGARILYWVDEAKAAGAKVLLGGKRQGTTVEPTVVVDVPADAKLNTREVFGPVVVVRRVKSFQEALAGVNEGDFGLQAGVFTHDTRKVREAFETLEVGGVIVNDYPTFRSDNMPYGGLKRSGLGREGVRYAMEELTEERALVQAP